MNLLGIDFGTTKTLAARWDERTKHPRIIRLGRGSDAIPTTIHVDKKGQFNFGDEADDLRAIDCAGWKGRIKRDLGRGTSVVLNGQSYRVADLIARFLADVLKRVEEESFHGKVDYTVVTVPALYGPVEREELKQAIKQAGFGSFDILEEPVAAGCAFLAEKAGTELGSHVLVFDWGGGTLDLALVEHRDNQFYLEPEWISGDKNLGGEDIDDSVVEGVDGINGETIGTVSSQPDERRLHILRNLKEGKELLSRRVEHTFRLPYEQKPDASFLWKREEFEHFTAGTVDQAIECLRLHLEKIRNSGLKVADVLLVGGSSEIPAVKRRIEEELGLNARRWENSQTAVALGAAVRAAQTSTVKISESGEIELPKQEALASRQDLVLLLHRRIEVSLLKQAATASRSAKITRDPVIVQPPVSFAFPPPLPVIIPALTNTKSDSLGEERRPAQPTPHITFARQNSEDSQIDPDNSGKATSAEDLRITHIKKESVVRFLGWFMFILFILFSLGAVVALLEPQRENSDSRGPVFIFSLIICSFFGFWAHGLLTFRSWTRWLTVGISALCLFGFPIGTIFGIFILWNLMGKKADFIFSPNYKEIIKATPRVRYKVFQGVYVIPHLPANHRDQGLSGLNS